MADISLLKDNEELKQIVEGKIKDAIALQSLDLELDPTIFLHQDLERRVTFSQIQEFYKIMKGETL